MNPAPPLIEDEFSKQNPRYSTCSIIVPVYNRERSIAGTIVSCVNQSYANLEIIIVDDGSTDRSLQVCRDLELQHASSQRKFKIISQPNQGACAARNAGLMAATGDYILFLDSDDLIPREKISLQISQIENEQSECSISDFRTIDAFGAQIAIYKNNLTPKQFITMAKSTSNSSIIMKSNSIPPNMRWNLQLQRMQDFDFMLRYLSGVARCSYLPIPLYDYRIHDGDRISDSYARGMPYFKVFCSMFRHVRENNGINIENARTLISFGLSLLRSSVKDFAAKYLPRWLKLIIKASAGRGIS
jgi:glycosyltransferase involved in cell wall biosynthesis